MQRTTSFTLNGKPVRVTTDDERMLLWVLREDLGLTGTKFGCGVSLCGACTVVINNEAVRSCSTPLKAVAGKQVLTVEGLADGDKLHPLQDAFFRHHAFQCGYCTSGMLMSAFALLHKTPHPTRTQLLRHMDDNFCRCGSHLRIVVAVEEVAGSAPATRRAVKGGAQ